MSAPPRPASDAAARTAALLQALVEATPDVVAAKDRTGRYLVANAATARAIGRPVHEIVGRTDAELFPPAVAEALVATDARVMATGRAETAEERVADANGGAMRTFVSAKAPLRDASGAVVGVVLTARDETASRRIQAERDRLLAALALERAQLAAMFEQAPVFLAMMRGPQLVFERVNRGYLQLVGHRDLVGRPLLEALPELVDQRVPAMLARVLRSGEPHVGTAVPVQLQRVPDGPREEVFVDFVYAPLADADGTRSGVVIIGNDVTERVGAERARAASEAKYRTLFESLDQGFCVIEVLFDAADRAVDYRFVETNPAFEEQTGLLEAVGRTARELVPSLEARWFEAYGHVALTGEPARLREGSESMGRWFDVFAFRVGAPEERRVGILFTDVSAAVRGERAREAALAAAEQASRAKSEFLANMSHELRTPLNAIQGHVQLLEMELHGPLTAAQREALARVDRAQQHLLGLINDVLNYTKLEAGRVEYHVDAVDLGDLLRDVGPMVEPQLAAKGLRYEVRAPDGPCLVWADPDKARQVLLNLLSNAAKFTPAGGRVTLDAVAPADEPRLMHVRVTDTGIGIPAAQRERIFEPFVQVHAGRTRTVDGTGLGLAISRDLAHGMGGELTVASAEGAGSTFTFALRRVRAATGAAVDRRAGDERRVDEERRSGEDRRDDLA